MNIPMKTSAGDFGRGFNLAGLIALCQTALRLQSTRAFELSPMAV